MQIFPAFENNSDVGANLLIARRLGQRPAYLAFEQHCKDMAVVCHKHLIFRQDATKPWHPRAVTNMFGEIPGMGKFPVIFCLPQ